MFRSDGRPLGFLTVIRRFAGDFTIEQITLAQLFAARAATALENARLHHQAVQDSQTKAMLLRELHHRVKNNLAGIVALLTMEESNVPEEARPTLSRLAQRIRVMARTHELFTGGVTAISLEELVNQVLASLSITRPPGIEIRMDFSDVRAQLKTDRAVSLAMVLHELSYNALTHGLRDHGVLEFRARLLRRTMLSIEISDNGAATAFSQADTIYDQTDPRRQSRPHIARTTKSGGNGHAVADEISRTGMGLQIVTGIVSRELHGQFRLEPIPTGGTRAVVEFPLTIEERQEGIL